MALVVPHSLLIFTLVAFFCLVINPSHCFHPKLFNVSKYQSDTNWSPAGATWFGSPTGAGNDGGSCGYGNAVGQAPFSSMISAAGQSLYKYGKGCGACYQVKCTGNNNAACSGKAVTVVITDECLGGPFASDSVHFELSGSAFGAMAISGQSDKLRNAGVLQILYRRVECNYTGVAIAFHVVGGSNPYYFATLIEYEDGDGDLGTVELKQSGGGSWVPMQQVSGAVWKLNPGSQLQPPLSMRLTTLKSGHTLVANNVIPYGWQPDQTYRSFVNFKS